MNIDSAPPEASAKEKFDLLFVLLKDYHAGLFDFQFKNVTVLTLILGWTLSSDTTRTFLHTNRGTACFLCVAILLYALLLSVAVWRFYRRSSLAYEQLSELRYMPVEYFQPRQIAAFTVVAFTVLDWTMAILISTVVLVS